MTVTEQTRHSEEHPRGTLAILVVYAVLFALGFFALYFFEFMGRGAPHP